MKAALCELIIEGVTYNSGLHMEILSDPAFVSSAYATDTLERLTRRA